MIVEPRTPIPFALSAGLCGAILACVGLPLKNSEFVVELVHGRDAVTDGLPIP